MAHGQDEVEQANHRKDEDAAGLWALPTAGALPPLCTSFVATFPCKCLPAAPGLHVSASLLPLPDTREGLALFSGSNVKNPRDKVYDWLGLG